MSRLHDAVSLQLNVQDGNKYRAEPIIKMEADTRYCQHLEIHIDDFKMFMDFKAAETFVTIMRETLDKAAIDIAIQAGIESAKNSK